MGQERIAEDLEAARVGLAAGTAESIHTGADLNICETGIFQHLLPACTRQATGNSGRP